MTRYDSKGTPAVSGKAVGRNSEGQTITPLEAVFDRQSVDQLHEKAEAEIKAPEPVHLDGLSAVRRRGGMGPGMLPAGDGTSIPMVPRMTRTIPAPHQRQRIAAGRHGKTWAYLPAEEVRKDDIVVDFGKVDEAWPRLVVAEIAGVGRVPVRAEVVLVNIVGNAMVVPESEQLRVFRVHENS